jgi:DNA repair exonuclease SbcCD nuclease subunit
MFTKDTLETVEFVDLNTEVYGFSYHTRDITEPIYDSVKRKQNDRIQILLAHGGDERDIPMNRRKLQEAGFDYIALGHIHKPDLISDKMAYSGSLEPLDKNETGDRGYILGEIANEGKDRTKITFVPSSVRQYKREKLLIDQNTTNGSLLDQAKKLLIRNGSQHIYQFCIQGIRDEAIHFDREVVKALGNILEVIDESVPDYDFDVLCRENADNLIGLFIKKIRESTDQDEVAKKALYYGMEALLGARDEKR